MVRNYFGLNGRSQTKDNQLNTLDDLIVAIGELEGSRDYLLTVSNGYSFANKEELERMNRVLHHHRDSLRELVRVGVHEDVGVDFASRAGGHWHKVAEPVTVTQVYVSALSLGRYMSKGTTQDDWSALGTLILEAAYELTLAVGAREALKQKRTVDVFLTMPGLGVFGNKPIWVAQAAARAVKIARAKGANINVHFVHFLKIDQSFAALLKDALRT